MDKKPSPEACYGGFAQLDGSCIVPNGSNNNNLTTCSAAQQCLANAGSQLSTTGKLLTYGGVSLDILAGAGGLLAPEAAPVEIGVGGTGTNMITVGGAMETLGSGLTGVCAGWDARSTQIDRGQSSSKQDQLWHN